LLRNGLTEADIEFPRMIEWFLNSGSCVARSKLALPLAPMFGRAWKCQVGVLDETGIGARQRSGARWRGRCVIRGGRGARAARQAAGACFDSVRDGNA
jgi:hypothetical protein